MGTQRQRLRQARHAKGLTQTALADLIDISQVTLARLETEKTEPTLRVALALAAALDVTVQALFADPDKKEPALHQQPGSVTTQEEITHAQHAAP